MLTVRLPCCDATTRRFSAARRARWFAALATVVLSVLALVSRSHGTSGLWPYMTSVLVIAVALGVVETIRDTITCRRTTVGLELDASRRWVTLRGVHPGFKSAVQLDEINGRSSSDNSRE